MNVTIVDPENVHISIDEQKFARYVLDSLLRSNLENCTNGVQPSTRGEDCMVQRRVPVGINEFGVPIMRHLQAKNEYELMLRAAKITL